MRIDGRRAVRVVVVCCRDAVGFGPKIMGSNHINSLTTNRLFIFVLTMASSAASLDTLKRGDAINSSTNLVSTNNMFSLGFFSMGDSNNSYLGIWYNSDGSNQPFWVGNRDVPINNNSGTLVVDSATGKLLIKRNGGDPIVLYDGQTSGNATLTLLDSGNLVMRDLSLPSRVLWQSFDYPTDTLVPGMKLGVNHVTGKSWKLTSWLTESSPASGAFTLEWDTKARHLFVRRRGVLHWSSGVLKNNTAFEFFQTVDYNFLNVSKKEEAYFIYSRAIDKSGLSTVWALDYQGQIKDHKFTIARVDLCDGYNTPVIDGYGYGECLLWEQPTCRNRPQQFMWKSGFSSRRVTILDGNSTLSVSDCQAKCWNECHCVAFKIVNYTCGILIGKELRFDQVGATFSGFVLLSDHPSHSSKYWIWILLVLAVILLLLIMSFLCCLRKRKIRLKDQSKREFLDWGKRLNIIEGVAQGLLYLHKYSRMRIIHRDLKASNILLDENMNPKISDFGLARIFEQNETAARTKRTTLVSFNCYSGYMAPEYAMEGNFSVKSDVFSFGVLVLEIVSGRRNSSFYHHDRLVNLIGYAWDLWKEGNALKLQDPAAGDVCVNQLLKTIHVGLLCVQESATDRPTMSVVSSMLSSDTMQLPAPKQPAFFTGRTWLKSTPDESKSKEISANNVSITEMETR
ncbi:hypothetical protein RJ640_001855 [Escallonia rubra]|uniref:non-specific serine/threonine protein kinase n=1 Tax=Escallonia rubra TaxID=112253 RepID=A0AA88S3A3_9ASTE|nr:hypothetical protein RJ640_001855 [Escallonia rubra]